MFWKFLVGFLVGAIIGYIIKDNWSKPDVSNVNNNKIKQKGEGNVLNFLQELKQRRQEKKLTRKERRQNRLNEKGR